MLSGESAPKITARLTDTTGIGRITAGGDQAPELVTDPDPMDRNDMSHHTHLLTALLAVLLVWT